MNIIYCLLFADVIPRIGITVRVSYYRNSSMTKIVFSFRIRPFEDTEMLLVTCPSHCILYYNLHSAVYVLEIIAS